MYHINSASLFIKEKMNLLIKKNKEIIKDIIDPTPGLFIDDQSKPNEQNF